MAIKKSELYSSLWQSCDELRGGMDASILVLDKENAQARKGIFMIDTSKGFIKDGNKNRLREQDKVTELSARVDKHLGKTGFAL